MKEQALTDSQRALAIRLRRADRRGNGVKIMRREELDMMTLEDRGAALWCDGKFYCAGPNLDALLDDQSEPSKGNSSK